jgi:dCTP deaminase
MPFWSGETLKAKGQNLISDFDPSRVDCAAYTLRLGSQVFATHDSPSSKPGILDGFIKLEDDESPIQIPPGQFALLQTAESVRIPNDALGFISIKAKLKFKGLINVSGFHVDPGWEGHLLFSVFNASPTPIILKRHQPAFLLWYAKLDQTSKELYPTPRANNYKDIPSELMRDMSGSVPSLVAVNRLVDDLKSDVRDAVTNAKFALYIVITISIAILGKVLLDTWKSNGSSQSAPAVAVSIEGSTNKQVQDDQAVPGNARQTPDDRNVHAKDGMTQHKPPQSGAQPSK